MWSEGKDAGWGDMGWSTGTLKTPTAERCKPPAHDLTPGCGYNEEQINPTDELLFI
jgi:hypothetical protein